MTALTSKTIDLVNHLFPAESQTVQQLLETECGQNLPLLKNGTPESLERIRFAALKVSKGNADKLLDAISPAKHDWRDLLMWADFGNDLKRHEKWAEEILNGKS